MKNVKQHRELERGLIMLDQKNRKRPTDCANSYWITLGLLLIIAYVI